MAFQGTDFFAWQASGTVCFFKSLLVQIIFFRQKTYADPTVHPAWSNELFFHHHTLPHFQ
jgi:hypothetical protein